MHTQVTFCFNQPTKSWTYLPVRRASVLER